MGKECRAYAMILGDLMELAARRDRPEAVFFFPGTCSRSSVPFWRSLAGEMSGAGRKRESQNSAARGAARFGVSLFGPTPRAGLFWVSLFRPTPGAALFWLSLFGAAPRAALFWVSLFRPTPRVGLFWLSLFCPAPLADRFGVSQKRPAPGQMGHFLAFSRPFPRHPSAQWSKRDSSPEQGPTAGCGNPAYPPNRPPVLTR